MQSFLEILREFESYGGKGIVYGGCLRDALCGVGPIKDIDIAVENTAANDNAITAFVARVEDTEETQQFLDYDSFPDVRRSVQVTRPGLDLVVNFVVLGPDHPFGVAPVAERCDFGICQVALDSDGNVYTTAKFTADKQNYTFTYARDPFDDAQFDRSLRRFDRLTEEKFSGWLLRVPGAPDKGTYREAAA